MFSLQRKLVYNLSLLLYLKYFYFACIPLFRMSVRCSKFESDPSKELCSVLSWSQFTLNPRILPDHLCSDLKSSVSLTTAISPTSRAEAELLHSKQRPQTGARPFAEGRAFTE